MAVVLQLSGAHELRALKSRELRSSEIVVIVAVHGAPPVELDLV
jgi:hypothetical protein